MPRASSRALAFTAASSLGCGGGTRCAERSATSFSTATRRASLTCETGSHAPPPSPPPPLPSFWSASTPSASSISTRPVISGVPPSWPIAFTNEASVSGAPVAGCSGASVRAEAARPRPSVTVTTSGWPMAPLRATSTRARPAALSASAALSCFCSAACCVRHTSCPAVTPASARLSSSSSLTTRPSTPATLSSACTPHSVPPALDAAAPKATPSPALSSAISPELSSEVTRTRTVFFCTLSTVPAHTPRCEADSPRTYSWWRGPSKKPGVCPSCFSSCARANTCRSASGASRGGVARRSCAASSSTAAVAHPAATPSTPSTASSASPMSASSASSAAASPSRLAASHASSMARR
eukprot:scaffold27884_cov65-Phaeocystis_antarctica.AAC.1